MLCVFLIAVCLYLSILFYCRQYVYVYVCMCVYYAYMPYVYMSLCLYVYIFHFITKTPLFNTGHLVLSLAKHKVPLFS
jgi:hypothetical protein